jgi:hypothetical protein
VRVLGAETKEVNDMLLLFHLEVGYGNGWTSFVQLLH